MRMLLIALGLVSTASADDGAIRLLPVIDPTISKSMVFTADSQEVLIVRGLPEGTVGYMRPTSPNGIQVTLYTKDGTKWTAKWARSR